MEETNLDGLMEYGFTPTDLYLLGKLRAYESVNMQYHLRQERPREGYL